MQAEGNDGKPEVDLAVSPVKPFLGTLVAMTTNLHFPSPTITRKAVAAILAGTALTLTPAYGGTAIGAASPARSSTSAAVHPPPPNRTREDVTTMWATTMAATAPVDPHAVFSAFVPPDELGVTYSRSSIDDSPTKTRWEAVKDRPGCESQRIFQGQPSDIPDHAHILYPGPTPVAIRYLDVSVVTTVGAQAAMDIIRTYPSTVAECATAAIRPQPGWRDYTTSLTDMGPLPSLPVEATWLHEVTTVPSRGIHQSGSLVYLRNGPLLVLATLSGAPTTSEVMAVATDLANRTVNALRWLPTPTVMPAW
jgi:hypothetical protein